MRDAGRHGSHQGYERGEMADASCMALQGLPLLHVHVGRARASRCAYHLPAGKLRESAASCNKNMYRNAKARTHRSTLSWSECSKGSQFSAHGCNCQHCCCRLQPPQEVAVHVAGGQLLMEAIRGCIATRPITTKLGAPPTACCWTAAYRTSCGAASSRTHGSRPWHSVPAPSPPQWRVGIRGSCTWTCAEVC